MAEDLALALALRRRLAPLDVRFAAAFAALALLFALVVGIAAWKVASLGTAAHAAQSWSAWQPRSVGFKGAQEIGEHVAPMRAVMVRADVVPPVAYPLPFRIGAGSSENRIRAVVVHERGGTLRIADSSTVGYSLCGRGQSCALDVDTAERRLLARREALEVALYTFTYLGFERVFVLMPPRPGDDHPVTALLFRRHDLAPLLEKPLRTTISAKAPTVSQLDGRVGARLERLTAPYFYAVGYVAAPGDAAPVVTLAPTEAG